MSPKHLYPAVLFLSLGLSPLPGSAAHAQASRPPSSNRPDSNIDAADTQSLIAPALPIPGVPSADPPFVFLQAARGAVQAGRTGEAQEGLERAETRILDRSASPAATQSPDNEQAELAIGVARRALAAHDRPAAIAAIDDALAASGRGVAAVQRQAPALAAAPIDDQPADPVAAPVIQQVQLPGHWKLDGATYRWVPPETAPHPVQAAATIPGRSVWIDGAYQWVPAHYAQ